MIRSRGGPTKSPFELRVLKPGRRDPGAMQRAEFSEMDISRLIADIIVRRIPWPIFRSTVWQSYRWSFGIVELYVMVATKD